jgi:hypothetical protein
VTNAFAAAVDALFADPNIAEDAIWKPGGTEPGIPVRIIRKTPDRLAEFGDSRAVLATILIDVRVAEVASPASGDVVAIGPDLFEIIGTPTRDAFVLVWTCEVAMS